MANKYFKCFTTRAAQYLCRKGFNIEKTEVNYKDPRYNVFLFLDSPELRKAFDEYQIKLQNSKNKE